MPRIKGSKNKKVETMEAPVEEIVASKVSTARKELEIYIAELKRTDIHQYSVREAELLNKLKQL